MKIVVRIALLLGVSLVLFFGAMVLFEEIVTKGVAQMLHDNPYIWVLIFSTFLGLFSLSFQITKFIVKSRENTFYKLVRIGDLLFAMYLFTFTIINVGDLVAVAISRSSVAAVSKGVVNSIVFYSVVILFTIFLFMGNFRFHKSLAQVPKTESIDDIGVD
jgi:hypothetical protein